MNWSARKSPAGTGLDLEDSSTGNELQPQHSTGTPGLTMLSTEIAELTGKRHDHVLRDIRSMLDELYPDDRLPSFGVTVERSNPSGGEPIRSTAYRLPKREVLILVSGYSTAMRARIIDRWQQLEAQTAPAQIPKTLPEALRLAADLAEKVDQQGKLIAAQAPDVEFVDRFVRARDSYSLREAAKIAQVPEREFLGRLLADGVLFRMQGDRLMPKAEFQHRGLFQVKAGESHGKAWAQTRFTARGVEWIAKRYGLGVSDGR